MHRCGLNSHCISWEGAMVACHETMDKLRSATTTYEYINIGRYCGVVRSSGSVLVYTNGRAKPKHLIFVDSADGPTKWLRSIQIYRLAVAHH
jgi:hypothetical protein